MRSPEIRSVYTVPQLCEINSFSKSKYYDLRRRGLGPREMVMGGVVRITHDDMVAWQRAMADPRGPAAAAAEQARERLRQRAAAGWAGKERRRLAREGKAA